MTEKIKDTGIIVIGAVFAILGIWEIVLPFSDILILNLWDILIAILGAVGVFSLGYGGRGKVDVYISEKGENNDVQ